MAHIWQGDLFDEEGHLTDQALSAFIQSTDANHPIEFDELQRLEIAEHLAFCDTCVLRYTELLSDADMLPPSDLTTAAVMRDLEKKQRQGYAGKWLSMAVAASLAIFFWVAGVFSPNFADLDAGFLTDMVEGAVAFSQQTVEISTEITDSMGNWVEKLNWRGEQSYGKE
ncbi:MAG: hypothetical protein HFI72_01480 [Peptococcaceae bacterium]|jgi:hypothetical protein|nr:hypothetical protein [Peptococcaceae bacterium]